MMTYHMPHLDHWTRVLALEPSQVAAVQAEYDKLYATPTSLTRAQQSHWEQNILPGLAMYRVIRDLAAMEKLIEAQYASARKLMGILRYLPDAFDAFRYMTLLDVRLRFPAEMGRIELIENNKNVLAFNQHSCFLLDTLTAYGARELAASYCQADDFIYGGLPPTIRWERTRTLGRGGDCCNFRWSRATIARRDAAQSSQ